MLQLHLQNYTMSTTSCTVELLIFIHVSFSLQGQTKAPRGLTTKPAGESSLGGRRLTATTSSLAEGVPRYPRRWCPVPRVRQGEHPRSTCTETHTPPWLRMGRWREKRTIPNYELRADKETALV